MGRTENWNSLLRYNNFHSNIYVDYLLRIIVKVVKLCG